MENSPFKKLLLILLLVATGAALLLQFLNSRSEKSVPPIAEVAKVGFEYHYAPSAHPAAANYLAATNAEAVDEKVPVPKISHEQAEAWLLKHNRNAMSLLAAFRALGALPDEEKVSFHRRKIIFGETAALQWLLQQHPPANPPK